MPIYARAEPRPKGWSVVDDTGTDLFPGIIFLTKRDLVRALRDGWIRPRSRALLGWGELPNDADQVWRLLDRGAFTPSQQLIIEALWARRGNPITKSRLMDIVYADHPYPPLDPIIRVHLCRIRKKLPAGWRVETRGWSGYALVCSGRSRTAGANRSRARSPGAAGTIAGRATPARPRSRGGSTPIVPRGVRLMRTPCSSRTTPAISISTEAKPSKRPASLPRRRPGTRSIASTVARTVSVFSGSIMFP